VYQQLMESQLNLSYKEKATVLLSTLSDKLPLLDDSLPVVKSMKSDAHYYTAYFDQVDMEFLSVLSVFSKVDVLEDQTLETIIVKEKMDFQTKVVSLLAGELKNYPANERLLNEYAFALNQLAWLNIRNKTVTYAFELISKAEALNVVVPAIKATKAHCLLLMNKKQEALLIYNEIKNEKNGDHRPFLYQFKSDFEILKNDGIQTVNFEKILEELV